MRCLILTQDDPFYLADNLKYLFSKLPTHSEVVGCVVFDVSPFGKRESFIKKAKKTLTIFGTSFFMHYALEYVQNRFNKSKSVKNVLKEYNIPLISIEGSINSEQSLIKLGEYNPDILISIAGNQIFKEKLLNLAPKGCLNLHTALLPKYRGLMPTFWVLKNNEKYTGVSVFFVDNGIDSGPILVQKKVEIGDCTQKELIKRTKEIGIDAIVEAIDKIHFGDYELIPNKADEMTYFSFPTRQDVEMFYRAGKKFF